MSRNRVEGNWKKFMCKTGESRIGSAHNKPDQVAGNGDTISGRIYDKNRIDKDNANRRRSGSMALNRLFS